MSQEQLESILAKGNAKACVKFFAKLSEKQRQAMAKAVQGLAVPIIDEPYIAQPKMDGSYKPNPRLPAAEVAALAVCSLAQLKKIWRHRWQHFPDDDVVFAVFSLRKPAWLDEWAAWACERDIKHWRIIRRLIRAGLCCKPNHDNYTLGMITHLCSSQESKRTIYDALMDDPDLLREDIWRVFEIAGNTSSSLAGWDRFFNPNYNPWITARTNHQKNTWSNALVRLAQEKKLPRHRLLDASLDASARDFGTFQAGWFSRFHEALEPTLKERARRAQAYLALLASRVAPTVSFALKALTLLIKDDLLKPSALLASITPALANRHKGTVQLALQLLDLLGQLHPRLHEPIGLVIAEALLHPSPDVHKKAIDLLSRCSKPLGEDLAQALRERLDHVAASQRARLLVLLGSDSLDKTQGHTEHPDLNEKDLRQRAAALDQPWRQLARVDRLLNSLDAGQADLAGINFDPMAIPRLDPSKRIPPIETVEELIDLCANVLENLDNTTDLERVLDGISRLCAERPDDFDSRTGPLRKRARDFLTKMFVAPFLGCGPGPDLCGLAHAWLAREVLLAHKTGVYEYDKNVDLFHFPASNRTMHVSRFPTVADFQSQRILEIAQRSAAVQAAPLLAAPTHQGGWIEPATLVARALARQGLPMKADRFDQIQALLRLSPDGREVARKPAGKVRGEFGQALRYALGEDEKIGADAPLWIAAARARAPFADDHKLAKAHPGLGPNASAAATYHPKIQEEKLKIDVQPSRPRSGTIDAITVLLTARKHPDSLWHREFRKSAAELHWMMQIWPIQRETWFGFWVQSFADNLDWYEAAWGNRVFLEPLLDQDMPLRPMARLLLALGLSAKEPGESGLATDALIAAIDDARFDALLFGESLAFLLPMLKANRLARSLAQAARVSPLHRHLLNRAVQASLRGNPATAPRDLVALLELLKESLIESGESVTDSEARKYLEKFKPTGKTAKVVRDLLNLANRSQPGHKRQLLLKALGNRIERAESWNVKGPLARTGQEKRNNRE